MFRVQFSKRKDSQFERNRSILHIRNESGYHSTTIGWSVPYPLPIYTGSLDNYK